MLRLWAAMHLETDGSDYPGHPVKRKSIEAHPERLALSYGRRPGAPEGDEALEAAQLDQGQGRCRTRLGKLRCVISGQSLQLGHSRLHSLQRHPHANAALRQVMDRL